MPYKDPEKQRETHIAVSWAIRSGKLVQQPCEVCGVDRAQAHHHNGYEREHFLDVQWLCPVHHKAAHA